MKSLVAFLLLFLHGYLWAQSPVALQGVVRSQAEGAMEGVVVSAKRQQSTITVSVVSNRQGEYQFPQSRLPAGAYDLTVRAVGYELTAPTVVTLTGPSPTVANLTLDTVQDISAQLTNAEWMASMPGSDREKRSLLTCVTCHTLERVVKSKYSSQEFLTVVLPRMQSYVNQSMPGAPQMRKGARLMEEQGEDRVNIYREMGEFLAQINLHNRTTWTTDRIARLNLKNDQFTEYLLPHSTNVRRVFVQDNAPDPIFWVGSNHGASIVKLEPLK